MDAQVSSVNRWNRFGAPGDGPVGQNPHLFHKGNRQVNLGSAGWLVIQKQHGETAGCAWKEKPLRRLKCDTGEEIHAVGESKAARSHMDIVPLPGRDHPQNAQAVRADHRCLIWREVKIK